MITKILIVEDEYDIANLISGHLTDHENKCDIASSFEKAETFINNEYDVLIVDVLLKDEVETGIDFAIKYKELHHNVFIIAISGNESIKIDHTIVDYFMRKPLSLEKISNIINVNKRMSMIELVNKLDTTNELLVDIKNLLSKKND